LDRVSLVIGTLLIALGVGGYVGSDFASKTALIPSYFGAAIALCGLIVLLKPAARKHAMHAAATVALIGFVAAAIRLVKGLAGDTPPSTLTLVSLTGMALLCGLFVILAIQSFKAARRARQSASA
jgi:hypothetical protein